MAGVALDAQLFLCLAESCPGLAPRATLTSQELPRAGFLGQRSGKAWEGLETADPRGTALAFFAKMAKKVKRGPN